MYTAPGRGEKSSLCLDRFISVYMNCHCERSLRSNPPFILLRDPRSERSLCALGGKKNRFW
jgi:hypothetical protein